MVTAQGNEGHITHTAITSYGYGTLRLKKGPNQLGPIFSTLYTYSYTFFNLIKLIPSGSQVHTPPIFYFRDPISRLTFATPFCDSH